MNNLTQVGTIVKLMPEGPVRLISCNSLKELEKMVKDREVRYFQQKTGGVIAIVTKEIKDE